MAVETACDERSGEELGTCGGWKLVNNSGTQEVVIVCN